jgi:hypothetical protein
MGIDIYTVYIRTLLIFFTLGFELELNIKDGRLKERGYRICFLYIRALLTFLGFYFVGSVRLELGIQDK